MNLLNTLSETAMILTVSNPGVQASEWATKNLQAIFPVILIALGLGLAIKRKVLPLILTLFFGAIGAVFVYQGSSFMQKLGNTVSSFF